MKGYKFIQKDMKSRNGSHKWKIGKWYKQSNIKLCKKGFHACKEPRESLEYIYGDKFFLVEARGKTISETGDKFVAEEMRLVKEIDINVLKRFAIWCAKQCLKNYEKIYPDDKRVFEAIEGAELYLDNKISLDKLNKRRAAANSAAHSAAHSAANSAYYSAANSTHSAQNKQLLKLIKESFLTPKVINKLKRNEIFIFGSNMNGNHAGGAAKLSKDKFKAEEGIFEGLTGKSYAFPTLNKQMKKVTKKQLENSVKKLIKCAKENPDKIFYLTKVGCGIAGFKELEIKKYFKKLPLNISKPKGW